MSYGVVKNKRLGMFDMDNQGTVVDFTTGIEYPIFRPDDENPETTWKVEKGDIVSFDIVNGKTTNVKLYRKHVDGLVYYKKV